MMRKLFQTQCPAIVSLILVCFSTLWSSCNNGKTAGPGGYDMRRPAKRELGKVLNEISGLDFSLEDSTLLAISDSKRKIFRISLKSGKLKDVAEKFHEQADFEDLVRVENTIYVLISDGTLLAVPYGATDSTGTKVYPPPIGGKNDFETLYHDPSDNLLVMLCKSCEMDKGQNVRSAFRFDLAGKRFDSSVFYTISRDDVKAAVRKDDADFKPSAAAIHPLEKRLYILSSAGQLLVITNKKGKVLEAYGLNPDMHPQAEGIAFAPNGSMYISNEGKYGKPTLQMFSYRKAGGGNKTKR